MTSIDPISERDAPFLLKGGSFTLMVLKLIEPDAPDFFAQLGGKLQQAPAFFRNAPVVLDLEDLELRHRALDVGIFARRLREQQLIPVGVQGGSRQLHDAALAAGLAVLPPARTGRGDADRAGAPEGRPPRAEAGGRPPAPPPSPRGDERAGAGDASRTTLTVTEPVRSGRQVYAAGGDLIVLAPVSPGAELLADGNIHVYGALRGRALAGIAGNTSARIFCRSLEAELVSIAGLYRVSEDFDPAVRRKDVQIYLDDGYLRVERLSRQE